MRARWMVLTLLTAAVLACGDDSKSKPVERGDFDAALARAMCERYARCGRVEDLERCEERERTTGFTKQYGLGTRYDAALEAGRVRYDAEAAGACVAFLGNLGCEDVQAPYVAVLRGIEYASECRFLQGTLADGASCQRSTECQDGAYCDAEHFSCGGVCRRGPPPEPVATADACPPGTVIIGDRCRAPSKEGGPCGLGAPGGAGEVGLCEWGHTCDWGTGKCRAPRKEGESCDFGLQGCVWSLTCRDGRCQKRVGEGASCTANTALGRECREELFCDADDGQDGTCRSWRAAGDSCRDSGECGDRLYCAGANPSSGTRGMCQPRAALDAPCRDVQCEYGLICSHTSRTCQPFTRYGEPCTESGACGLAGTCASGICLDAGSSPCP